VLDSVLGGEVDFGLAIDPLGGSEFDRELILRDPFVLVCRPDHPLAQLDRVPWRKLQGQPLVLLDYSSGSRRLIDHALSSRGIEVDIVQQTGHTLTAFRMIEAGLGISVSPALSPPPPTLVTRPLTPAEHRDVVLLKRRQRSLSPLATLVWDRIRAIATNTQ
jgi:DNA-binding transcriptional LysR family regulator